MQLRRDVDLVREEANVLWWVFGERSRDTYKRWSECTVPECALMAGKELADLVRIPAGSWPLPLLCFIRVVKFAKPKTSRRGSSKGRDRPVTPTWRQNYA